MGLLNAVAGVARAFIPKEEEPPQEPTQIMIVDGRQRTKKEELQDWMNGDEPPNRVTRIHDNIQRMYNVFGNPVDGQSEDERGYGTNQQPQQQQRAIPPPAPLIVSSRRERDIVTRQKKKEFKKNPKSGYTKPKKTKKKSGSRNRYDLGKWKI